MAPLALAQSVKINWIEPSVEENTTDEVEEVPIEEPIMEEVVDTAEEPVDLPEEEPTEDANLEELEDGGMSLVQPVEDVENTAPVFYTIDPVESNEGEEIAIELFSYDADNDPLEFSSTNLPEGATIENNVFRWAPSYETIDGCWYGWLMRCRQTFKIDFTVSDGISEDSETLKLKLFDTKQDTVSLLDEEPIVEEVNETESIEDFIPEEDEELIEYEIVDDVPVEEVADEAVVEEDIIIVDEDLDVEDILGDEEVEIIEEEVTDIALVEDEELEMSEDELSDELDDIIETIEEEEPKTPTTAKAAVIKEGEELVLTLGVFDPDNDTLTFEVEGLDNYYFEGNDFHWIPSFYAVPKKSCWHWWLWSCSAQVPITFKVSDGENEITQDFMVKIIDQNAPPYITPINNITIGENELFNLTPEISDADGDKLKIKFSEPLDEKGQWLPGEGNVGEFPVTVSARDSKVMIEEYFTINVVSVESKPVIDLYLPEEEFITVKEGTNITFNITASDADFDELSYIWKLNDQIGSTKDYLTVLTSSDSEGEYFVTVDVSDTKNNTASVVWQLNVENVNLPPTLTELEDISVSEGEVVSIILDATDEDNDELSYTISEPVGNDGTWKTSYDDAGTYEISVEVTDGVDTVTDTFNIEVTNVNLNAPVIETFSPEESTLNILAGESVEFIIEASDNDDDPLSYSWAFNGEKVGENDSYIFNSEEDEEGTYQVEVIVSDGEETASLGWQLNVEIPNRAPELSLSDIVVKEGEFITLDLPKADLDGDRIIYYISEPLSDQGVWQTTLDDAGVYDITVSALDDEFNVTGSFVLTVLDVNNAPIIAPIDDVIMDEGQTVEFEVVLSDEDEDEVTLTVEGIPEGAEFEDSKFEWTPGFDAVKRETGIISSSDSEEFVITLTADDGTDTVEQKLTITVNNVNHAPSIEQIDEVIVNEGDEFTVTPVVEDIDGDELTIKFDGYMSSDTKKAGYSDAGSHLVTVTVSDGLAEDSEGFVVTVIDVNQPPTFQEIAPEEDDTIKIAIRVKEGSETKDGSWLKNLFGW